MTLRDTSNNEWARGLRNDLTRPKPDTPSQKAPTAPQDSGELETIDLIKFIFDRYAADRTPTDEQIESAIKDYKLNKEEK